MSGKIDNLVFKSNKESQFSQITLYWNVILGHLWSTNIMKQIWSKFLRM